MKAYASYVIGSAICLSGCTATDLLSRNLPSAAADQVHIYSSNEEPVLNLIDKALAGCPDETEMAETECVKEALSQAKLSLPATASLIPGCKLGSICHYDHTTRRRLGLIPAYATIVVRNWRVAIDMRGTASISGIPEVKVTDREVFVVSPSKVPATATANAVSR